MPSLKNKPIDYVPIILSILLSLGTLTVFHACEIREDGTWMHCHEAQNAVVFGGLLLAVFYASAFFIRNKAMKAVFSCLGLIGAVVLFFIPGPIITMCMMHTMRCYTVMQPFARILSVLTALTGFIQIIQTLKNNS